MPSEHWPTRHCCSMTPWRMLWSIKSQPSRTESHRSHVAHVAFNVPTSEHVRRTTRSSFGSGLWRIGTELVRPLFPQWPLGHRPTSQAACIRLRLLNMRPHTPASPCHSGHDWHTSLNASISTLVREVFTIYMIALSVAFRLAATKLHFDKEPVIIGSPKSSSPKLISQVVHGSSLT